jgi:hypothetical protein
MTSNLGISRVSRPGEYQRRALRVLIELANLYTKTYGMTIRSTAECTASIALIFDNAIKLGFGERVVTPVIGFRIPGNDDGEEYLAMPEFWSDWHCLVHPLFALMEARPELFENDSQVMDAEVFEQICRELGW